MVLKDRCTLYPQTDNMRRHRESRIEGCWVGNGFPVSRSFLAQSRHRVDFCCASSGEPACKRGGQHDNADLNKDFTMSGFEPCDDVTEKPHPGER